MLCLDRNSFSIFLNRCVGVVLDSRLVRCGSGLVVVFLIWNLSLVVRCIVCSMCIGFFW